MPGRVPSREFKIGVCQQVASGQKRPSQVCREHNLSESVLIRWRKEFEERGETAFTAKQAADQSPTEALRILRQESLLCRLKKAVCDNDG